jgi:acetyl-CoA acetyltransferase
LTSLSKIAAVAGIGHSDFVSDHAKVRAGNVPHDAFGYAAVAFGRALDDAGIAASDIDGFISGPFTPHERMTDILGLNPRWGLQADAMVGIQEAVLAIHGGMAEVVALVYGDNQRSAATSYGGANAMGAQVSLAYVYHAPWGFTSQGAIYAMMARRFMHETGFSDRDLGEVAIAQRAHASRNPSALMQKPITIDDYLAADHIVEPLRLLDYCLVNDGGVALIIMSAERAKRLKKRPVMIHGIGRADIGQGATSLAPRLETFYRPTMKMVADRAFGMAGIGPKDVSAVQIYDSFSIHVPLALEGYGYCGHGDAARFLRDTGISLSRGLPVNTHGGHLSESYMQGWTHQVEAVRQLRGECGPRQVQDCRFVHYASVAAGKTLSIIYGL